MSSTITYAEYFGLGAEAEEGVNLLKACQDVASLRKGLFTGYPYFYDPEIDSNYEESYLQGLRNNSKSHIVLARSEGVTVGAATALPLVSDAEILEGIESQFRRASFDPDDFFYYSEILVMPHMRRRGIAAEFYRRRHSIADTLGYKAVCFSTIDVEDGLRKPDTYFDPAPLWRAMGFERRNDISTVYKWPTLQDGVSGMQEHRMVFWLMELKTRSGRG